ncbi:hypothetical protein D3C79_949490 [compost metagenome]
MTGTTAQVQHASRTLPRQLGLQQGELTALGVHGAAEVGTGLFAELALDHIGVGAAGHGRIPFDFGLSLRPLSPASRLPPRLHSAGSMWKPACRR